MIRAGAFLILAGSICLGIPSAMGVILDDGRDHEINYAINDYLKIYDNWRGSATTVNLVPGGATSMWATIYDTSKLNISGGLVGDYLTAYDSSEVTITSGSVGSWLSGEHNSRINISGGLIGSDLRAFNNSEIFISGGLIGGSLQAYNNSRITISDGLIGGLYASQNSYVIISGGSIGGYLSAYNNSRLFISGGLTGDWLGVYDNSQVTIFGTDFNYSPGPITAPAGRLTGTLQSGQPIDLYFYSYDTNASITLVPEPSTFLLLSWGWWLLRRKR